MKYRTVTGAAALGAVALLGALAFAQHGKGPAGAAHGGMMKQSPESKKVEAAVTKIKAGSHYNCCIQPKCDWCAVHMGSCPCGMNAAAGKPVCINCKGGWEADFGAIPGKKPADIKVMTKEDMEKMMGGMRGGKM